MDYVAEIKMAWEKWENSRPVRERNLSATGFNALLHGEPVSMPYLESILEWGQDVVSKEIQRMVNEGRATINGSGELTGVMGLSVVPAPHKMKLGDTDYFTWCGLDALSIPPALETDAVVTSRLLDSNEQITLSYQKGEWQVVGDQEVWLRLIPPVEGISLCGGT
jgi:hypothetical protein